MITDTRYISGVLGYNLLKPMLQPHGVDTKVMRNSSTPPVKAARSSAISLAATLCGFLAASAYAQVLPAVSGEGDVLVISADASTPQSAVVDGVNLSVTIEGSYRVYRAFVGGRTHSAHVALDGPPRHMAFDRQQRRFREVLPSLVVELGSYALLDEVVEAAGGLAGKAYPELGFAVVQLPETANPAQAARALQEHPAVNAARVQLGGQIRVPL